MKAFASAIAVVLLAVTAAVSAQSLDAIAGTWHGSFQTPGGMLIQLQVQIEGNSGSWQQTPRGRPAIPNPCLSRSHPIEVSEVAPGSIRINVQASKTIAGCQDGRVNLQLVDPNHLVGAFLDGRPLKLERK